MLTAIETTGTVSQSRSLELDEALPAGAPRRVRVIVIFAPEDEVDAPEWLSAAARNEAFDFLRDPAEDIYTPDDGRPLAL